MTLDGRDRAVVQWVASFSQLASSHIQALVFKDLASHTPCNRTLKRLAERRYLARIERRTVGGSRGGSGQYVYALGPRGHVLYRDGRYIPTRTVNYHSLAIADTYLALYSLSTLSKLDLLGFTNTRESYKEIGRYKLTPDLFVELQIPGSPKRLRLWFEVDMGSEGQRQIIDKLERYWGAYQIATENEWPDGQYVVFIAVDEYRARELRWFIEKGPSDAQELFRVWTLDELTQALG